MPKKVFIVWGTEDVRAAGEGDWKDLENMPTEYTFPTSAEAEAFLKGVDEATGWMDYMVLDEHLVNVAKEVREGKR